MQYFAHELTEALASSAAVRTALLERKSADQPNRLRCTAVVMLLDRGSQVSATTTHIAPGSIRAVVPTRIAAGQPVRIAFRVLLDGASITVRLVGRVSHCTCVSEGFRITVAMKAEDEQSQSAVARLAA
jgi:hypothetical protein